MHMRHLTLLIALLLTQVFATTAQTARAQGLFSPAVIVNDTVITEFEIEQRERFLILLNAPGTSREAVIEDLIDEKLRMQAVNQVGFDVSDEQLETSKATFAGRVNLSTEEFVVILEENGVAEETFDDFVRVGIAWGEYVRGRFGPGLVVTEDEIDQALGNSAGSSTIRVLLAEIIIPAPPERLQEVEELAAQIAVTTSQEEFSDFAREFSATATRDDGGRLPWQTLSELPPVLRPLLLGLAPGEVTEPISIPNAVALFQMRGIEEAGTRPEEIAAIEYAAYFIPGGRTEAGLNAARKVRARVDTCDDLYGVAQGQPEEVLDRASLAPGELPNDYAIELAKLDPGESSIALTRSGGQTLVFLMLCGRTAVANEDADRADVASALRTQRLNAIAESFLDQIRADSRITFP